MNFYFLEDTHGMIEVHKDVDGGCGSFSAIFPTMEEAQIFVIRILIADGSLPRDIDLKSII